MYIVTIQNNGVSIPIHDSKEKLISGKVTKGINTIDSFQFSMLPSNAGFNEIHDYKTLVKVYNTNKRRYDFYGRVLYSEDTMDESGTIQKDVICESYFGFLCDSQQEYVVEQNWTVRKLLEHIVNMHNSQVEEYKQFTIGEVTMIDPNDNVYIGIQRENTWETLNSKLLDKLGGEVSFRVEDGVNYIDYLVEIGKESGTEIALSKNMKAITRERDPSEIVTRLIPLGCKLTGVDADGTDIETEQRLDITLVNDGKSYIEDEAAIALYGIRVATVEFDDVTVASTLKTKGMKWLTENNRIRTSYTATALDLSLIGLAVDDFDVGNSHPLKNHLLNIDDTVRIIKKSIDICEEIKSTIEFGDNVQKLSETLKQQSANLKQITSDYATNKQIVSIYEKTTSLIQQTDTQIRQDVSSELIKYVTADTLEKKGYATIISLNSAFATYLKSEEGIAAAKIAVSSAYITDDDLTDALGNYLQKNTLNAGIEAYIDTSTGIAKLTSAVSGTYVSNDSLGKTLTDYAKKDEIPSLDSYLLKAELNAEIGAYIDTAAGKAKVESVVSGTYATKNELGGYLTTDAATSITQSVSAVESKISLSSEYSENTIGTNVYALLQLVSNANSSAISVKADKIDFTGFTTFVRPGDLSGNNTTTINGSNITTGTITAEKISTGAITADKISTGAITADKIKADAITADKIAANTITADEIAAGAITASEIATGAVTAEKIATGAITADKIAAGTITADKIKAGAVTTEKIAADAITADKIAANTITADEIATGTITASEISTGAITAEKIKSGAITADKIAASAITAEKIAAGAITADKIATGAITADKIAADSLYVRKMYGQEGTNWSNTPIISSSGAYVAIGNGGTDGYSTNLTVWANNVSFASRNADGDSEYLVISTVDTTNAVEGISYQYPNCIYPYNPNSDVWRTWDIGNEDHPFDNLYLGDNLYLWDANNEAWTYLRVGGRKLRWTDATGTNFNVVLEKY